MVIGFGLFFTCFYAISEEVSPVMENAVSEEVANEVPEGAMAVNTEVEQPAMANAEMPVANAEALSLNADINHLVANVEAVPIPETGEAAATMPTEETKWIWAEVTAVDPANSKFTVKYLSYDSDEEKELTLITDANTKMENFKSLSEMTMGDNVSVDYISDASGKSTAKSISLQKSKPAATATEPAATETVTSPGATTNVTTENVVTETPQAPATVVAPVEPMVTANAQTTTVAPVNAETK